MQEYEKPIWSFTHNNGAGNISTKSLHLEDDTWTGVLQEFIYFLRGLGYSISDDSVAINSERHMLGDEWFGGYYVPEVEQVEDDWKHPDDFDPLFEGEPDKFNTSNLNCSVKFSDEEINLIKQLNSDIRNLGKEIKRYNDYQEVEFNTTFNPNFSFNLEQKGE